MNNSTAESSDSMTIWDAYRAASRRRASLKVVTLSNGEPMQRFAGGSGTVVKVQPRRNNGFLILTAGTADQIWVTESQARSISCKRAE